MNLLPDRTSHLVGIFSRSYEAGKTTVAKVLVERGYTRIPMALPIKEVCRPLLAYAGFTQQQIAEIEDKGKAAEFDIRDLDGARACNLAIKGIAGANHLTQVICEGASEPAVAAFHKNQAAQTLAMAFLVLARGGTTVRRLYQVVGTEWGRMCVRPDLWVEVWKRRAENHPFVVIDDVRYLTEVDLVRLEGGDLWEVESNRSPMTDANHSSEGALWEVEPYYKITNNLDTTLEQIKEQVDFILSPAGGDADEDVPTY